MPRIEGRRDRVPATEEPFPYISLPTETQRNIDRQKRVDETHKSSAKGSTRGRSQSNLEGSRRISSREMNSEETRRHRVGQGKAATDSGTGDTIEGNRHCRGGSREGKRRMGSTVVKDRQKSDVCDHSRTVSTETRSEGSNKEMQRGEYAEMTRCNPNKEFRQTKKDKFKTRREQI
jgi:hypothetical protein